MKIYDMHCDTISRIWRDRRSGVESSLRKNNYHLDLEKMRRGGYGLQCFAAYIDQGDEVSPEIAAREMIQIFHEELNRNADLIRQVTGMKDVRDNEKDELMSAMLTIEGGEACLGNLELLREFYQAGVRLMTLTWNYENELGFPNLDAREYKNGLDPYKADIVRGLKEQGILFVEEMEALGMLIDVSHLSDAGFYDVAAHTRKPFVASHSNARAVAPFVRNLTDEMIRILAERGGVMGINYCADFLYDFRGDDHRVSRVEDMVRQISYIRGIGGIDVIGLGSDFDGIEGDLEISDCSKMELLIDGLKKESIPESEIDKILSLNVKRVLTDVLG